MVAKPLLEVNFAVYPLIEGRYLVKNVGIRLIQSMGWAVLFIRMGTC